MAQLSRRHEFQADAYAQQQTSGADLASALLKLFKDNASTLTPDPLYARFYYSHPPASERIARLRTATSVMRAGRGTRSSRYVGDQPGQGTPRPVVGYLDAPRA